jgi:cyclic pyranopterin phosphate synthase
MMRLTVGRILSRGSASIFSISSSSASYSSASNRSNTTRLFSSSSSSPLSTAPIIEDSSSNSINRVKKGDSPLMDKFGRFHNYLRVSLTERCNLRCTYCMPLDGVPLTPEPDLLSLEEQRRTLSLFAKLGTDKVRFTGGEPTLSKALIPLLEYCRDDLSGYIQSTGLTTNGVLLERLAPNLKKAGLKSVNVSLDTLSETRYEKLSRRSGKILRRVLAGIKATVAQDIPVKINCVLQKGVNDEEMISFLALAEELNVDMRFIEFMPFGGNKWNNDLLLPYKEALNMIKEGGMNYEIVPSNDPSDTTKWYRVEGHKQRFGFITSMSNHFCATCNRLRITADGNLKVCLFGADSLNLIDVYRSGATDEQVAGAVLDKVRGKKAALGGNKDLITLAKNKEDNRPMILIGG